MLAVIKGAGDIASGIAYHLFHAGISVIMTELANPTSIRRMVCFSEAVFDGSCEVEGIRADLCGDIFDAKKTLALNRIAVIVDKNGNCIHQSKPDIVIDAILAKKNTGTSINDADYVIGIGPGFTAGVDCHAVIETMRGHTLGRIYFSGKALPDTGVPGSICGYSSERVMRAPSDGVFRSTRRIGDMVNAGDPCAFVNDIPMRSKIPGVIRGLLRDGTEVFEGMKAGDVDPRGNAEYCFSISEKAMCIGSSVLSAISQMIFIKMGHSLYEM